MVLCNVFHFSTLCNELSASNWNQIAIDSSMESQNLSKSFILECPYNVRNDNCKTF